MAEVQGLDLKFTADATQVQEALQSIIQTVKNLQMEIDKALGDVSISDTLLQVVVETKTQMDEMKQSMEDMAKQSQESSQQLSEDMKKVAQNAKQQSDKTVSAIDRIKAALKALGKFFAIGSIITLVKKLTTALFELASETLISTRLLNATFGDMAETVSEFGEALNRAWGVSATSVNKNVSTMYQLAKNLGIANQSALNMSKGITQLSYELANLYGKDQQQAFTALKNAVNGQYRTLKKEYNIAIDETRLKSIALANGIISEGQSLNSTTKAMAAYLAIVQQSQGAVGSMTSGTRNIAQQMQILKAQLSDTGRYWSMAFAPILTYVIPAISALINVIGRLGQYFAAIMSKLFGFGNSWKDTANALAGGGSIGAGISSSMEDAEDSIGGATGALKKMNKQLLGIDELNVLKQPEDSGGSGGGGAMGGYGGSFTIPEMELPDTESEVQRWADAIINALKPTLDFLKSVGESIGILFQGIANMFKSFWENGGERLAKSLKDLWDAFMELGKVLNESAIKPVLEFLANEVFPELGKWVGIVADGIAQLVEGFTEMIRSIQDSPEMMRGLELALQGIAIVLGAILAYNVVGWIIGIVTAIGSLISLPGLVIAAFGALAAFLTGWIAEHWDSTKSFGENILIGLGEGMEAASRWLMEKWTEFWDGLVEWFRNLFGVHSPSTLFYDFGTFLLEGFMNGIQAMWDAVKSLFESIFKWIVDGVKGFIDDVIKKVTDFVKKIIDKVIEMKNNIVNKFNEVKNKITSIVTGIKTKLGSIVSWVKSTFVGGFQTALNKIRGFFSGTFNALVNIVKVPFNSVIDLVNRAIDGLNSIHVDIPWWVPGFGGKSYGISIPKMQRLYTGGLAYGAAPALVGDYPRANVNPEVIAPLDKLDSMLLRSVRTALIDANQVKGNDSATYVIQLTMDGKVVSQKVIRDIRQYEANTGKMVFGY